MSDKIRDSAVQKVLYDPWLIAVVSQIVGGILSGLIVYYLTESRNGLSDRDYEMLFGRSVKLPKGLSFLLNWHYVIFYLILLAGIIGITLMQDPLAINWYQIAIYVVLITWWSMVALNVFVLMDGATLEGPLPMPILLFLAIIIPIVGHTNSVKYTLFAFIIKVGLGILFYGIVSRFPSLDIRSLMSTLLSIFAWVDTIFYAHLFLRRYPEFSNWREGRFIIELGWPK